MGALKRMRKYKILQPLFFVRDWLMKRLGLFDLKSRMKRKRFFVRAKKEDETRRKHIEQAIFRMPTGLLDGANREVGLIVSLTSYGKRVEKSSPYAIYSILQQTMLPDKIVLNIDKARWNDDNIPAILKRLKEVGITICYVGDIGPHTKLIPSLRHFPDDVIITVDDDVFYDKKMIEELYSEYLKSDRRSVVCREGKVLQKKDGKYLPYSQQLHIRECGEASSLLPFGVAGVLYPPHIFGNEVFNTQVIADLCPKADDIWFGIMELYYKIPVIYVPKNSWTGNADVDRNEEYNETVSGALHFLNDIQGLNDVQWNNLMEYYHLNNNENLENV